MEKMNIGLFDENIGKKKKKSIVHFTTRMIDQLATLRRMDSSSSDSNRRH